MIHRSHVPVGSKRKPDKGNVEEIMMDALMYRMTQPKDIIFSSSNRRWRRIALQVQKALITVSCKMAADESAELRR